MKKIEKSFLGNETFNQTQCNLAHTADYTSRNFYTRRIHNRQSCTKENNFSAQKVISMMSNTYKKQNNIENQPFMQTTQRNQSRAFRRLLTETADDGDISQFRKVVMRKKIKQSLFKVSKCWSKLYDRFEAIFLQGNIACMQENYTKFLQTFYQNLLSLSKNKVNNTKNQLNSKEQQQNISKFKMQNIRLQKQNQILLKMIRKNNSEQIEQGNLLQKTNFFKQITESILKLHDKQAIIPLYNQQIELNIKQIESFAMGEPLRIAARKRISFNNLDSSIEDAKIRSQNQRLRQENKVLQQQKIQLKAKLDHLKTINQNICNQIVLIKFGHQKTKVVFDKFREQLSMAQQDAYSHSTQLAEKRMQLHQINRKYLIMLRKLKKVDNRQQKHPTLPHQYYQNFGNQLQSFTKMKASLNLLTLHQQPDKSTDKRQIYQQFLNNKETCHNMQGIKRTSKLYSNFFKPKFYEYIQHNLKERGIDKKNYEIILTDEIGKNDFIGTLRAIFDSKYNQFLLLNNFKLISSFASFCFSWLGNFYVDKKTKQITSRKQDFKIDIITNFYCKLMGQYYNCNWQVVTFREFLLQSLSIDELYFYLMTRSYLLKGQIMDNFDATFADIYYVDYLDVLKLIHQVVTDVQFRKQLQETLKEHLKYFRKKSFIDAHFALRIILQFYREHRRQMIHNICTIIKSITLNVNSTILSFEAFMRIFDYKFTDLSIQQKLSLYNKCYIVGSSSITSEIVISVMAQQNLFCSFVHRVYRGQKIAIEKNQQTGHTSHISHSSESNNSDHQLIFLRFVNCYSQSVLDRLGLEIVKHKANKLMKFNQQTIFERNAFIFEISTLIAKKFYIDNRLSMIKQRQILNKMADIALKASKLTVGKLEIRYLMYKLKIKNSGQRIYRFYWKKKRAMLRMYKDIEEKEEDQNQQGNLREQFVKMINQAKKKYLGINSINV